MSHSNDFPTLVLAEQYRQEGRLADASSICRALLTTDPDNVDTLLLLGAIATQLGDSQMALDLTQKASAQQPSNPFLLVRLGNVLMRAGRSADAERTYRSALAIKPDMADAYTNLGTVLLHNGQAAQAEQCLRKSIVLAPESAVTYSNLSNALETLGRHAEAEQCARTALSIDPAYAEAHNNFGIALQRLGRLAEAEQSFRRAIELMPDSAEPNCNLGATLQQLGRQAEAEQVYCRALELDPGHKTARLNYAFFLLNAGRIAEAEACYRRALERAPDHAAAHLGYGKLLQGERCIVEAEQCYRRAFELAPESADAFCHWLHARQHLALWEGLENDARRLRELVLGRESAGIAPFMFMGLPGADGAEQLACARQYALAQFREPLSSAPLLGAGSGSGGGRLRIGYISGDFREHPIGRIAVHIIECHDRRRFEVHGYASTEDDGSPLGRRIRGAFDALHDVASMDYQHAARKIAADGIDILVDISGYTGKIMLPTLALRPAPVQVNWIGTAVTFGHPRLADYLVGDPVATPLQHAANYSETLALMPNCYYPQDRLRRTDARPSRSEAGLPREGFVFCCFNQTFKITPAMFDIWCRLLKAVPGSVLWLLDQHPAARGNLRSEAGVRGIDPARILFAPVLLPEAHLARLQFADLALDTFPYTSHTTASDALWAGVPLVTMMGNTFASRVAASILHAAGLPEQVTADPDSFYRRARELATDRGALARLKAKLAAGRMTCALFDSERFTRDLERLYERMWAQQRAGVRQPITLD